MDATRIVPHIPESFRREVVWPYESASGSNIAVPYVPSELQMGIHNDPARFKLISGGERAGKSRLIARELTDWCFWPLPDWVIGRTSSGVGALFWLIGPDYDLTLAEFDYISDSLQAAHAIKDGPHRNRRDSSWLTTRLGTVIETKTAADARKVAAKPPNGIIIPEVAQISHEVFMRCLSRVGQTRGWVIGAGTFEGSVGWYPELWQEWQGHNAVGGKSWSIPSWDNHHIYPLGREDPEIIRLERSLPPQLFAERVAAIPMPPATLVFPEFRTLQHVPGWVFYRPELPVFLGVDPGYAGAYAVCVLQEVANTIWVVDEIYYPGKSGSEIINICKSRKWWPNVESVYMDIAAKQHHADYSQVDVWRKEAGITPTMRKVRIQDGIDVYHKYLTVDESGRPQLLFSEDCVQTIKEHLNYAYPTDSDNRPRSEVPVDRFNHAIKAITYYLAGRKGLVAHERNSYKLFTYKGVFA